MLGAGRTGDTETFRDIPRTLGQHGQGDSRDTDAPMDEGTLGKGGSWGYVGAEGHARQ